MGDLTPLALGPLARAKGHSSEEIVRLPLVTASFFTRQLEDRPHVVRTAGSIFRFGNGQQLLAANPLEATGRSRRAPANCAHGKVAVAVRRSDFCHVACYQLSQCHSQVVSAACGNTTAAAAAFDSRISGSTQLELCVELANQLRVQVAAEISPLGPGTAHVVRQTWSNVPLEMQDEQRVADRHYATCLGSLNDYVVVRTAPGEDPMDFTVEEAFALWRHFGLDRQPLRARLAVVQPSASPLPRVKFFTCGQREHPSAPLTGLAVLAFVAQRLEWLEIIHACQVLTPSGLIGLPGIYPLESGRVRIEIQPVVVQLLDD